MESSKPTDIVFMFPPAQGNVGRFRAHLGVSYLRTALAQQSIASVQYLNPYPGTVAEVARDVLALNPGVVGFTAYDANFLLALALARSVVLASGMLVAAGRSPATSRIGQAKGVCVTV